MIIFVLLSALDQKVLVIFCVYTLVLVSAGQCYPVNFVCKTEVGFPVV